MSISPLPEPLSKEIPDMSQRDQHQITGVGGEEDPVSRLKFDGFSFLGVVLKGWVKEGKRRGEESVSNQESDQEARTKSEIDSLVKS